MRKNRQNKGITSKVLASNSGDLGSIPGSGRSPGEENGNPTPVLLPRKFHGWRSLVGYSPWGQQESDMTERLHFVSFFQENFPELKEHEFQD